HGAPQSVSGGLLRWTRLRIPVDVLARDPDSSLLPVESVQIAQMSEHDITDFFDGRFLGHGAVAQERGDLTKNPRSALCAAADHQSICAGFFKYVLRFVRRVDVAIGKNGNRDGFLDGADRCVLRGVAEHACPRPAVDRQSLYADFLRHARDGYAVAMFGIPTGAHLE